jgi:hypothetical protein
MDKTIEMIKSLVRPIGLLGWLAFRVVCFGTGIEVEASMLMVVLDAATAEYFAERAYTRYLEAKNGSSK